MLKVTLRICRQPLCMRCWVVITLAFIVLSVITLVCHYHYCCHAECHYAEFHHAECHYAERLQLILFMLGYHYAGCHYAEF